VAKILVADDNSNIQKMVGLALKDQGIDVVAVGNGEAAVRKISDVRPDLVLADVFMPVRNGYEVCKYVKDDSALSHIPVILLVGAFDPLDEQEAQRVGADGVLKKPFVPPDPLISMVKSALTRAGVAVNGAAEAKQQTALPPIAGADLIAPRVAPPAVVQPAEEQPLEESFARPSVVKIDAGAPVAFGNLLETQATEEEEEVAYIAPASPAFAGERNWGGSEKEEEEEREEEESSHASWRRDGGNEGLSAPDNIPSAVRDWRDTAPAQTVSRKSGQESWDPATEQPPVAEVAATEAVAEDREGVSVVGALPTSASELSTPAGVTPWPGTWQSTVTAEPEISAPVARREPAPAVASIPSWDLQPPAETAGVSAYSAEPLTMQSSTTAATPEPKATKKAEAEKPNSWFSTAPSPWDAEVKKASELGSTWDVGPEPKKDEDESESFGPKVEAGPEASVVDDPNATQTIIAQAEEAGLPESAVETIREEAAEVAETAQVTTTETAKPGTDQPNMDDLVARVLAKMSPEVLQAVTREILKPVIEAIVKDELNSRNEN
jgi:CheY-like chemotaxis protein